MIRPNLLLASHPEVAATTLLWSRDGAHFATIIAKLELDAKLGTVVKNPSGVEVDDRFEGQNPLRPLLAVGEAAPYLPQCDVIVLGAPRLEELTVQRGTETILHKRGAPADFQALPRIGPERKRMAPGGALPHRAADGSIHVSSDLPWTYFHCAPADQRTAHLTGGETVALRAGAESLSVTIAHTRAVARVWLDQTEVPIRLLADMLVVDLHRAVVALVFRGLVSFNGLSPATIRAVTALQVADREADWARVVDASPQAKNGSAPTSVSTESTRTLTEGGPPPSLGAPFPIATRETEVHRPRPALQAIAAQIIPASAAGEQTLGLPSAPADKSGSLATTRFSDEVPPPMAAPFRMAEPGTGAPVVSATPWGGAALIRAPEATGEETIALTTRPPQEPRRAPSPNAPLRAPPGAPPPRESAARTPPATIARREATPAPKAPPLSPREQMEKRLRDSGASEADIAILLARLAPPQAPPPDDD